MSEEILKVENLVTSFQTEAGVVRAIDGVSFAVKGGQTLGIVGESGCGKSVTSLSIMRLLPKPAGRIEAGKVLFKGQDILTMDRDDVYKVRGNRISMIFQEPMTALNPVYKVKHQLGESFALHQPQMSTAEIRKASLDLLVRVGIPSPKRRMEEYPHQLSGGMRQRVMIAIALACNPDILIADEPTTALDVTIQAQILELIKDIQREQGMAVIFITHDLGVIAEVCDEVVVMYGGRVAERANVFDLFANPKHPYTKGLLASIPRLDHPPRTTLNTIEGMVPGLLDMPVGCRFQNRCPFVQDQCRQKPPPLEKLSEDHYVSCYRHGEIS